MRLVGADGAVVDQHGGIVVVADQLDAGEEAGDEVAVRVGEQRPGVDGAGLRVERVVHEDQVALMRVAILVRQTDIHRVAQRVGACAVRRRARPCAHRCRRISRTSDKPAHPR